MQLGIGRASGTLLWETVRLDTSESMGTQAILLVLIMALVSETFEQLAFKSIANTRHSNP